MLSEEYATQIARDWNANERSGFAGYVLRFQVTADFLNDLEVHMVGDSRHQEYWIPADDLEMFNQNIVGLIEVVSEFRKRS